MFSVISLFFVFFESPTGLQWVMAGQAKNCKISVASRFLGASLTVGRVKCSTSSDEIQIVQEKVSILKTRQEVRLSFVKLQQNYH